MNAFDILILGASGGGVAPQDPDWGNVSFLLKDGTTVYSALDASGKCNVSKGGTGVYFQTVNAKFGTSIEPSPVGTDGYLSLTSKTAGNLTLGAGDFTLETWIRPIESLFCGLIATPNTSTGSFVWGLNNETSSIVTLRWFSTDWDEFPISLNVWTHVACCRQSGVIRMFVNGVKSTETLTYTTNISQDLMVIGTDRSLSNGFIGLMDEVRITKGIARYTANFPVPTAPFPTS